MTDKQVIEKLDKLFNESVRKTISEIKRPFGVFLSGGVDSGTLAALSKPDVVFTGKFSYGPMYDESKYAKMTVDHLGLIQVIVEPTPEEFKEYFAEAVKALGRTTTHFSLVPLFLMFKKASEEGVKTILMGEGPDEHLAGYIRYLFIVNEQRLYEQPEIKKWKYALDQYLGSEISRASKILGFDEKIIAPYWDKYENLLSKIGYCDLMVRGIEDMELKMAEYFGITLLYPYLTEEIQEFCFREIPDSMKIKGFTTKWPMKRVAEKYLPHEVVYNINKMGGPVAPVGLWLGQNNEFDKTRYVEMQEEILGK